MRSGRTHGRERREIRIDRRRAFEVIRVVARNADPLRIRQRSPPQFPKLRRAQVNADAIFMRDLHVMIEQQALAKLRLGNQCVVQDLAEFRGLDIRDPQLQ